MVSLTSASRYITSASRYHQRHHFRPSMYIRDLIPWNCAELAEAVPIDGVACSFLIALIDLTNCQQQRWSPLGHCCIVTLILKEHLYFLDTGFIFICRSLKNLFVSLTIYWFCPLIISQYNHFLLRGYRITKSGKIWLNWIDVFNLPFMLLIMSRWSIHLSRIVSCATDIVKMTGKWICALHVAS